MEKKGRSNRAGAGGDRNGTPPNAKSDGNGKRKAFLIAVLATLAVAVVGVGIAVVVSVLNSSSRLVAAETASEADAASQVPAGRIVFQPTHTLDAGKVEDLPAEAAHEGNNPNLLAVGSAAPDFTLQSSRGERVSLSDFRGKTVLLEFSATWCPHCQAEALHLKKIMASLPEKSFVMVTVNADSEDAASLEAFDHYYGLTSVSLLDPGTRPGNFYNQGSSGPVTQKYKVGIFPTFYIINPKGIISWRADHEQPDALLLEKLKSAAGS